MSDLDCLKQIDLAGFLGRHYAIRVSSNGAALCPFHDDHEPSLSVSQKNGVGLFKCFMCGSAGSILDFVMKKEGLSLADAARRIQELEGIRDEFRRSHTKKTRPAAWDRPVSGETIEAEYAYADEQGVPLYVKRRFRPKDFDFYHTLDGKPTWDIKGVRRVLFHLPEVIKHDSIWLVEGEKDVLTLEALGFAATTAGGAQNWRDEFISFFAGKEVVVCWDVDAPKVGRERARAVSKVARMTLLVDLERQAGLTGKQDITDFVNGLGDIPKDEKAKAVLALVPGGDKIQPTAAADELESCMFQAHLPALLDWIERARSGKYLGFETKSFPTLNMVLSGIRETLILSAVAKTGKTTLLSQISHELADQGIGVLYYDFENGRYPLMIREFCRRCRISYRGELLNADFGWKNIVSRLNDLYNTNRNFAIITDRRLTIEKIRAHLLQMRRRTGHDKIFLAIDSLQKLPVADLRDRRAGVDGWLRNLETLKAEDPDLAIMVISELSREGKPKESGDIEYTGHFVLELEHADDDRRKLWVKYARDIGCPKSPIMLRGHFDYWEFTEEEFQ